jgi:hypothetical protein
MQKKVRWITRQYYGTRRFEYTLDTAHAIEANLTGLALCAG